MGNSKNSINCNNTCKLNFVNQKIDNSHNPEKSKINKLIYDVALATFAEMGVSSAMTAVTCCFVASTSIGLLITTAIATIALNALFRTSFAYLEYRADQIKEKKDLGLVLRAVHFTRWFNAFTFGVFELTTTATLIHEFGHAVAALTVYQNPRLKISIFPIKGGFTRISPGPLTKLGECLGNKNSYLFVAAAGPAFGILSATIKLIFAHHCQKDHPDISRTLNAGAITEIASHVLYALSAFGESRHNISHDFIALWSIGNIHPVVSIVSMVTLPIFVKIGMTYICS